MTPRTARAAAPPARRLSAIAKSCRDIMRKDRGLNGDLDRLPMLTWMLFLKFLDDLEDVHRAEAEVAGRPVDFGPFYLHAKSGEFAEALLSLNPAAKLEGWPERVRQPELACLSGIAMGEQINKLPDTLAAPRGRVASR